MAGVGLCVGAGVTAEVGPVKVNDGEKQHNIKGTRVSSRRPHACMHVMEQLQDDYIWSTTWKAQAHVLRCNDFVQDLVCKPLDMAIH